MSLAALALLAYLLTGGAQPAPAPSPKTRPAPAPVLPSVQADGVVVAGWYDSPTDTWAVAVDTPKAIYVVSVSAEEWLELLEERRARVHLRAKELPDGRWTDIRLRLLPDDPDLSPQPLNEASLG